VLQWLVGEQLVPSITVASWGTSVVLMRWRRQVVVYEGDGIAQGHVRRGAML
jgi:hypothetical protein